MLSLVRGEDMNLEHLLDRYSSSPRMKEIADGIALSSTSRTAVKGLNGSSRALVFTSLYKLAQLSSFNHIVVLEDAEEAAYFHNDIEQLMGPIDLFYYPSSFKNNKNFQIQSSSHVMLRTEALTRLAGEGRKKIVITHPEALMEKVPASQQLLSKVIHIKVHDTLLTDSLMEQLVELGFERTDFVFEPGQFAMRGGIIDIYSFANEKPYRIELFGNEVDSIRIFDPESQLSERKLLQVNIIPNADAHEVIDQKNNFFETLTGETILYVANWQIMLDRYLDHEDHLKLFIEGSDSTTGVNVDHFTPYENFLSSVEKLAVVELGSRGSIPFPTTIVDWKTSPQPAFNRKFELLINDLSAHESAGRPIYIFSENPKQLERLYSIFEDLKSQIHFVPIAHAIHQGFIDAELGIVAYTDHQIFQRYHKYKIKQAYNKSKAFTLRALKELQQGDYVVHIDHGIGVFSGLQKIQNGGQTQEAVRIIYRDNDILYVNINSLHKISKYTGKEGHVPKVNKLGSDAWVKLKEKTKGKVKEIAFDLIKLYAERKAEVGFSHTPDNYLQTELEASFIYEDTPDQSRAISDVKKDMQEPHPMDRLVCGDVGFGKTEVAIRAAFKTCTDGKQAAVLVPTTILAYQHFKTFGDRLKDFPVTVDFINRFKSAKEKKETLLKVKEGKVDIIIGTHALLSKDVEFKDLGLLVIDEEQKFGVAHKEKIKTLKTNVDCLTLTATPIPRTLQFSLMGARDLSIINTPPPNRQPIQTEVLVFNHDMIRDAVYYEVERGGQVFFIHNRINGLPEMTELIRSLCPDLSIGFAHGQMEGHELEERIFDFIQKQYDVLVCTNIVESGVDIPNVNTIIINNAHQFGLSDLHQLRGRVGRSNRKAFCYLLAPPISTLPADSRKRLQTLEQHAELGSGFQIAMRDLDIRGAGNMLGGEQSGFMLEIGFEMYQKILDEAIRELKRTSFREVFKEEISKQDDFVQDCTIDTDLEIHIPDHYVEQIAERLSLYARLDNCRDEDELSSFYTEMVDRFGPMPSCVSDLFTTVRCRRLAVDIGFERMILKQETLKCFFVNNPDSPYFQSLTFNALLVHLQTKTNKSHLKQTGRNFMLITEGVSSMDDLHRVLDELTSTIREVKLQNGITVP
jgi:transcription-repair coupling factor (superfamily II helicase)